MNLKIKFIKKAKAYFVRLRLHVILGFSADFLIYLGYLIKMSKWIDKNKSKLRYNDFYNSNVIHGDRFKLYEEFLNENQLGRSEINYLEFGVAKGSSLRWWSENNKNPNTNIYAFDTYEGLPEDYGSYTKGTFSLEGNFPNIPDDRIDFIKGLFQETLLTSLERIDFLKKTIIHIDGDLYSSALYTLTILYPHLKPGDIIIFDEFVVPSHEFKAFDDFVKSFYIELEPVGAINNYLQVIFEVKSTHISG